MNLKNMLLIASGSLFAIVIFVYNSKIIYDGRLQMKQFDYLKKLSPKTIENLSNKTIYFGHQSVGYDIVDGIIEITDDVSNVFFCLIEVKRTEDVMLGTFGHGPIGNNKDPFSKIKSFVSFIENGVGDKIDIAFFKFCYIDITSETDIEKVFQEYCYAMEKLSESYPDIIFVHVTVPLRTIQTGWKAKMKKIIGKPIGGYADNFNRYLFNSLILKKYDGKEPVFDLAKAESTFPDGGRYFFYKKGIAIPALIPSYTDDGGHLNQKGRREIAFSLLEYLSNIEK